jgi:hypothetical protein
MRSGRRRLALACVVAAAGGLSATVAFGEVAARTASNGSVPLVVATGAQSAAPTGATGVTGPQGQVGPAGPPGVTRQAITVSWQNGAYKGHDTSSFVAPGIGRGTITCNLNTQWINFTPYDLGSDSEMWGAIFRNDETSIRAAARRSPFYGNQFNIGLNQVNGSEPSSQGSMTGIISSRGPFGSPGGAGAAPTTFHLSWYWSFADGFGPRCYVAGVFVTGS